MMMMMNFFVLLLSVVAITTTIPRCDAVECQARLGMTSGLIQDHQISASSYYDTHRPERARFGNKSAWCVTAENGPGAYLEVDLNEVKRLTWLGLQGFGNRYVTNYTIQYKRRKENKHWRPLTERLPQNITKIISFRDNYDNTSRKYTKLKGSRILRYIRIVLLEGVGKQWCLKLELYGCKWENKDGLISYQSGQGNVRGNNKTETIMNDATYDGNAQFLGRRYGVLQGGLGQLTDGDIGGDAFWYDLGNGKGFEWVGWFDVVNVKPAILFEFDSPRRFHKIFFHGTNRPGNVKIFRNFLIAFSTDGNYFSRKFVFHPSQVMKQRRNQSMWIEVDLSGHVGKYLNCEFAYDGKWIVLSEIEFESVIAAQKTSQREPYIGEDHIPKAATPTNTPRNETEGNGPSLKPVGRSPVEKKSLLSLPVIIAMAIVGLALVLFTVVLVIWLAKRNGSDGDGTHPLRNAVRIVNSLKGSSLRREKGSSLRREKAKHYSGSSDSDEDVEDLVQRKMNNFVPRSQPWYKSLDRHKMNNVNRSKSWKQENEMEEKEAEKMDKVDV